MSIFKFLFPKKILLLGTDRNEMIKFIENNYDMFVSNSNIFVHFNTKYCITEKLINSLTESELQNFLNDEKYEKVIFCSSNSNCKKICSLINLKNKNKLTCVCY